MLSRVNTGEDAGLELRTLMNLTATTNYLATVLFWIFIDHSESAKLNIRLRIVAQNARGNADRRSGKSTKERNDGD